MEIWEWIYRMIFTIPFNYTLSFCSMISTLLKEKMEKDIGETSMDYRVALSISTSPELIIWISNMNGIQPNPIRILTGYRKGRIILTSVRNWHILHVQILWKIFLRLIIVSVQDTL